MKILASYNIKGGVGKTTSIVNLAYLAARKGYRTLLWDLDPQGAASFYFRIKPRIRGGLSGLLGRKRFINEAIKGTDYPGLDLIPADQSFRYLDVQLSAKKKPLQQFSKLLGPLEAEYDLLMLDCAPGLSLASENVFMTADALLVPVIPTTLSMRSLEQLQRYVRKNVTRNLRILPFVSMLDHRKRLHRETLKEIASRDYRFLRTIIASASQIEMMGERRAPLGSYGVQSASVMAYESLWSEIESELGLR